MDGVLLSLDKWIDGFELKNMLKFKCLDEIKM